MEDILFKLFFIIKMSWTYFRLLFLCLLNSVVKYVLCIKYLTDLCSPKVEG